MNSNDKQILKDDINFLEYPTWVISERNAPKSLTIEKENGKYVISTTDNVDRLPDRIDKIVLYYILSLVLPTHTNKLIITRYNILKNAFGNTSKQYYNRIIDSLNRWLSVTILFDGVFYDGDKYTKRGFHIIDGYKLNNGNLEIYLNEQYLEHLRKTNYFKLINLDEYKKLKKPTSARLFEILTKTFKDRDIWQIHIVKLAEKLTLEKRNNCDTYYPSDVVIKIRPATKEIHKNTNLKVKLEYNKDTQICTFKKVQNVQQDKQEESHSLNISDEDDNFKAIIPILPEEHRNKKTILEAISTAFRKHGFDYVKRNTEYSNKHCKNNYRAYLNKALKEDWGLAFKEDETIKQKKREEAIREIEEQVRGRKEAELALQKEQEFIDRIVQYIKDLSEEEQEALRHEAIARVDPETQKMANHRDLYVQLAIRQKMQEIAAERLNLY